MFVTLVIILAAVFAVVTGIASRRRGGGVPVRDRNRPTNLLAGGSEPREFPDPRPRRGH